MEFARVATIGDFVNKETSKFEFDWLLIMIVTCGSQSATPELAQTTQLDQTNPAESINDQFILMERISKMD